MRLGLIALRDSPKYVSEFAKAVDDAGFWGLGVPDTAPLIRLGAYPTIAASLVATNRLHVGPFVTNPVTRHWSVHAADARAFEDFAPGRFHLMVSPGDGAVRSVGLKPATWAEVEAFIAQVRPHIPPDMPVFIAASGPNGVAVGGRVASDVLFGLGLDEGALRTAIEGADRARKEVGIKAPLRRWVDTHICVVPKDSDAKEVRAAVLGQAISINHYRLGSTFAGKNVPEEFQPILRERLARYDFNFHAPGLAVNPNALLFEDHPEIEEYLLNRTYVIGSAESCAERLETLASSLGLDGVWFGLLDNPFLPDPVEHLHAVAAALKGLMDE